MDCSENDDKLPIILIDLKEISYFIQRHPFDSILGGRYDFYNHLLAKLCQKFCQNGAQLAFFMVGTRCTDTLKFFANKATFRYNNSMEILNKMRERIDITHSTHRKLLQCTRDSHAFTYNFKKLLGRFGNVHVTHIQHNCEIIQYINEHSDRVLALISNDTDFLAFEGDFKLWLTADIDVNQMTSNQVQKQKLYARLGFDYGPHQMRLLSALSGNVHLPFEMLIDFLERLENNRLEPSKRGKVWNISHYIRQESTEIIDNEPQFDLDKISGDVFGADYAQWQRNAIANGLAVYNVNFSSDELHLHEKYRGNAFLSHCKEHDPFLFTLATDDVYIVKDIAFADYQNYRSKTYSELVAPILMKICGILFDNDVHDRRDVRRIFMKHAHDEPFKTTEETIIYPPSKAKHFYFQIKRNEFSFPIISVELPDRFDLIFHKKDQKYDELRWSLLKWVLNLDDDFLAKIKRSPKNLFAVIVTLQYLVQVKCSL